jgi:ferredoxin-type protein NapF
MATSCLALHGVLCRSCGDACPEAAIAFPPALGRVARPVVDAAGCTGCGDCVAACPVAALALAPTQASERTHGG